MCSDIPFSFIDDISEKFERMVCPNLGRNLQEQDIGKKVIRVFPYHYPRFGNFDWSYLPDDFSSDAIHLAACELEGLFKEGIKFKGRVTLSDLKDSNWCTIDELAKHLKENPKGGITFKDGLQMRMTKIKAKLDSEVDKLPKTYPTIGRRLTETDIGKKIVRVFPFKICSSSYDWSYIPANHHSSEEITENAPTLELIADGGLKFKGVISSINLFDEYWCTVEEFLKIKQAHN